MSLSVELLRANAKNPAGDIPTSIELLFPHLDEIERSYTGNGYHTVQQLGVFYTHLGNLLLRACK